MQQNSMTTNADGTTLFAGDKALVETAVGAISALAARVAECLHADQSMVAAVGIERKI